MDSALSRLTDHGITQPVLIRIQSRYYVKADNTAILISDCSCFAEAAEFLFASFFVFFCALSPSAVKFFLFFSTDY